MRRPSCLLALLALAALPANAAPITFEFGGTLTENNNNAFGGANEFAQAVIGEEFFGHITFDPDSFVRTDCDVCSSSTYTDTAPLAMTIDVTFGGFTLQTNTSFAPTLFLYPTLSTPGGHSRISVRNDDELSPTVTVDGLHFISQTVLPSGNFSGAYVDAEGGGIVESPVAFLALDFTTGLDGDLSFLSDRELPLMPPDISLAENRSFSILGGFPNIFVRGTVDFLRLGRTSVPEPATGLLLAIGFGAMLVGLRRRHSRAAEAR